MSFSSETKVTRRTLGKIPALILHFIIFYAFWACWALFVRPTLKNAVGDNLLTEIIGCTVKLLIWVVPALLLVKRYEPEMFVGLRQMFTNKVPLKWVIFWTLLFAAAGNYYKLTACIFAQGSLHISPEFLSKASLYLTVVGITEEAVFRGWMLNATAKDVKDWKMILLNAVLFLSIHIPGWYHKGMLAEAFRGFGFLSIIGFSVVVSLCFLKHKNLLLPVFLHMLYDFLLDFVAA